MPAQIGGVPAQVVDLPEQQPGVTLQTYNMPSGLESVCTIRSGSTPNVDKVMPTINYSTPEDFGAADNFITHVTANLDVPADGNYVFRLTSDDGSLLYIDDELLIDNDGLHGEEAVDGTVSLTEGHHVLRVEFFEAGGGQILRLEWQPPGASGFEVVPTSVLSTEAEVVRVTAPGTKYCEGATDTAGDGLRLDSVNPNYDLTDLRPDGFEPMVSAMAFTEDDELVVVTAGSVSPGGPVQNPEPGEVFILDNVVGETSAEEVEVTKVATGLLNPMGVTVADGSIYVSERDRLTELTPDTDGDGMLEHRTVAEWPYGGNFHEFAFGLLHDEDYFYVSLSVSINAGGASTNPQPAANRGTHLKVDRDTGEISYVAGGLRTPNGMGWGPDGEIFVMDNQGDWLPSSKLVHIKQDRFFNHYTNPAGPFDDEPVTQPVLWLPQNEIGNSPSNPVLLEEGPFAGQMLFGDVTYGGLQRGFLELVDGEYQGAVFRHSAGLEAGINRTIVGPDGAIYVGGIGEAGNWSESGKLRYGLQKLTPNGENTFDMAEMRVIEGGFEVEYTQPLSEETAEGLAEAYDVEQWRYIATPTYGGPKLNEETLEVTGAELSEDRTTVTLQVDGLEPGRVVHLRSPRPFTAESGDELWSTQAWYTLNTLPGWVPGDEEAETYYEAEEGLFAGAVGIATDHAGFTGAGFAAGFQGTGAATSIPVHVDVAGSYDVGIRYTNATTPSAANGDRTLTVLVNGQSAGQAVLPRTVEWNLWATEVLTLDLVEGANTIELRVAPGDTGHVNVDHIVVRPAGERIVLFDGTDLSEWQHTDGREASWELVGEDAMEVANGDLRTKQAFGDYRMHLEFTVPELPADVTGQDRGNSGVYMQERYELQILDSYGDSTLDDNEAGSIYLHKAPDSNESLPPGEWQTYDLEFRAARYDAAGNKVQDARLTVVWNGVTVHDDVTIPGGTGGNIPEGPATGSIRLQDHGNAVQFRNIWIEPMDAGEEPPPPPLCQPELVGSTDDFDGTELDRAVWSNVVRENAETLNVEDGALVLPTGSYDMYGGNTNAENLVLRPAPEGAWSATTEMTLSPVNAYQQAGLMLYGNDANFVKLALIRTPDGLGYEYIRQADGQPVDGGEIDRISLPEDHPATVLVRMESDGTVVRASVSTDGEAWEPLGRARPLAGIPDPHVGVYALNGGGAGVPVIDARFESFTLATPVEVGPSDEFDGEVLDRCRWETILRQDTDHYRLADGHLVIDALDGDMHGGAANAANVILQDAPDGGWEAVTKVAVPQGEEYEQGGIIVHGNDQNFIKAMLIDIPDLGWRAEFARTVNGSAVFEAGQDRSGALPAGINDDGLWLKVTSDGSFLTAAWSADGETWTDFGRSQPLSALTDPRIGLAAYNGNGQPATFDFFRLEEADVEPVVCEPGEVEEGYTALFDGT
ncbi:family 16 glycoside hydrolase, partial [Georgenia sp. MJ206]|uniref:family 16 glycoside hydrolase n=1 Tax=Georgenia wangjunii TaxID=3117730 RepID=UPI002F26B40C